METALHPHLIALNSSHDDVVAMEPVALNSAEGEIPDWINVLPAGPGIQGIDGRLWTMSDADKVIGVFRDRGGKVPVDLEHATHAEGAMNRPAPAVGAITELAKRDTGLWAKVDWNDVGKAIMRARSYFHCSPVFNHSRTGEISRLVSVGLTNNPNLNLVALNRATPPTQETPAMDKAVAEALGLNADASVANVVAAINDLKAKERTALNRAESPDPERFVPKETHQLALNRVEAFETAAAAQRDRDIAGVVDAAVEAGKVAPADKDFYVAACKADEGGLDRFKTMVEARRAVAGAATQGDKTALNRAGTDAHGLDAEELAVCRATGVTAEDFAAQKAADAEKGA